MKNCRASLGYSAASLALLVLQACTPADPPSGKVLCAKTSPACPPGYYCASDQTCWKNGAGPDASAADGALDSTRDVGNLADLPSNVGDLVDLPSDVGASVDLSSDLEDLVDTSTISPDAAFRDGISDEDTVDALAERPLSQVDAPVQVIDAPADAGGCPASQRGCNGVCIPSTGCCVATDCSGSCTTCDTSSHTCGALKGQDDPTQRCGGTCDSSGVCKSKRGQTCTLVAGGCIDGTTCADGYCCNSACTGTCESCASTPGTCSLATGTPLTTHGSCNGSGTCGGSCGGKSASCTYPGAETICESATCSSGIATSARTCDSAGTCAAATTSPCGAFSCGAKGCLTSCTTVADCAAGTVCSNGSCVACSSGQTVCSNSCVDLQTDSNHCGSCAGTGAGCASGHQCSGGVCLFAAGQACVSNSDCASQVCNKFYYDGDGDGYPVSASSIGFCSTTSSPSSGYIPARSDGKWDCCDTDAGAHPGVTDYFSTKDVCGNFDWDCSGTEEKQSVHLFTRCVADTVNSTCSQTTSDNPPTADCGATWTGVTMCQITITSGQVACYPRTSGGTVTCH